MAVWSGIRTAEEGRRLGLAEWTLSRAHGTMACRSRKAFGGASLPSPFYLMGKHALYEAPRLAFFFFLPP